MPSSSTVKIKKGNLTQEKNATDFAKDQWAYALQSALSYNAISSEPIEKSPFESYLADAGWTEWEEFLPTQIHNDLLKFNLKIRIWEKIKGTDCTISVAFEGTERNLFWDWYSNINLITRFTPFHTDEYTELIATGHSLGGGLAQKFAYSLPLDAEVNRLKTVYAFDSSPITGYLTTDKKLRKINSKQLTIKRIYENNEILSYLRSVKNFVYPISYISPKIELYEYFLMDRANPIKAHSIKDFSENPHKISQENS